MEHVKRFAGDYEKAKNSHPDRVSGTGSWLYSDAKFRAWKGSRKACLFHLIGQASCGKSVLTKSLVDNDLNTHRRTGTVCYFFFTPGNGATTSASQVLAALMYQLYTQNQGGGDDLDTVLDPLLLAQGANLEDFSDALWANMLTICDHLAHNIVCVLDGLDECNSKARDILLDKLCSFYSSSRTQRTKLKFFVTTRSHGENQFDIEPPNGPNSVAQVNADEKLDTMAVEMNRVMRSKMRRARPVIPEEVQDAIIMRFKDVKDRTYRSLDFILDAITAGSTRSATEVDLNEIFEEMPRSVEGFYENVLNRSPNPGRTRAILISIQAAEHPMTLLQTQYVINLAARTHDSLDTLKDSMETNYDFGHEITQLCGLLVAVEDGKLRFAHPGVGDYLLKTTQQDGGSAGSWKGSISINEAHCQLALVCFRFLRYFEATPFPFSDKAAGSFLQSDATDWIEGHEFLEYAAGYWPFHYRKAGTEYRDELLPWLPKLLSETTNPQCTWISAYGAAHEHTVPYTIVLLWFLTKSDLEDCVQRLLDSNKNLSPYICVMAVWYATERRNKLIVRMILDYLTKQNFNTCEDVLDLQHRLAQPLRTAAKTNELEIFEMIIEFLRTGGYSYQLDLATMEAILNTQDDRNLQRVLEFPSGVNVTVDRLISCLHRASSRPSAMKLILRYKVHGIDLSHATWQRLIEPAMENLCEETVIMLMDEFPDFVSFTWQALMMATVVHSRPDILRLLLGKYGSYADLNTYVQALKVAATAGSDEHLRELLEFHNEDLDQNKIPFQNAFDWAAERNHYGCTELLLVDGRLGKYAGISHIMYKAAVEGRVEPTKSLLTHINKIQLEHSDDLHLALKGAAANGCKGTTEILLQHCQQADSLPENCYRSALNNAARNDHDDVVQLLLDQVPRHLSSRHAAFFRDTGEEDRMDLRADGSKATDADEPLFDEDELELDDSDDDDEIMHEGSDTSE